MWKEVFRTKEEGMRYGDILRALKNSELPNTERTAIFKQRFSNVLHYFNQLEKEEIIITEHDKLLFSLWVLR